MFPTTLPIRRCCAPLVVALLLASATAPAQTLAQVVDVRTQANAEALESQKRIDVLSDETDKLLSEYRNVLKQIDALRTYNRQMEQLVTSQDMEMASLRTQIDDVEVVGRGVTPLMAKMIESLDRFVALDVPFLEQERRERVNFLRQLMDKADVTNSEKFRAILEAYQIENDYGRTIEAYRGAVADGREVDFLRVGRIALVYQTLDASEAAVWDKESGTWVELGGGYRTAVKLGLRIARKQAAPDLIRLPLPAAAPAGGQG